MNANGKPRNGNFLKFRTSGCILGVIVKRDKLRPKELDMPVINTQLISQTLIITISRPEALNAINNEIMRGLNKTLQEVAQDDQIKGIIITGDGEKAFVAGADIKELSVLNREQI